METFTKGKAENLICSNFMFQRALRNQCDDELIQGKERPLSASACEPLKVAEPDLQTIKRVLVVDDSAVQRKILSSSLKKWGFEVFSVESGEDALTLCQDTTFDLVLSDWMMPGMNGLEFCRKFRRLNSSNYGYFILLTSKSEKGDVAEGLEIGADDFLTKPVNADELRARIKAGDRILTMQRELAETNRLISRTLSEMQVLNAAMDRDLIEARKLQQSLIPERYRDFGAAAVSLLLRPSGHVGGDLVGFFQISPDRIGLYAIDVSGHGITSALMTARLAGILSGTSPSQNVAFRPTPTGGFEGRRPSDVVARLNRISLEDLETETYFTFAYADVNLGTGAVELVQAGHPNPIIQRVNGSIDVLGEGGFPVGMIKDVEYPSVKATLAPGDRLLFCSDGLTECETPAGEMLEIEGLSQFLIGGKNLHGPAFLDLMIENLAAYAGGCDFADDISIAMLEFKGDGTHRL